MADKAKAADVRKDLYRTIERYLGRELTEEEHKEIRGKMIGYVTSVVPNVKVERLYTCRNCKKGRTVTKKTDQLIRKNQKGVETVREDKGVQFDPPLEELE